MKLLFDQNVSPWLCRTLSDLFPGSAQVRDLGLREADDTIVWEYAARHGFAIVAKDADFRQRRAGDIEAFLADEEKSFLGLS